MVRTSRWGRTTSCERGARIDRETKKTAGSVRPRRRRSSCARGAISANAFVPHRVSTVQSSEELVDLCLARGQELSKGPGRRREVLVAFRQVDRLVPAKVCGQYVSALEHERRVVADSHPMTSKVRCMSTICLAPAGPILFSRMDCRTSKGTCWYLTSLPDAVRRIKRQLGAIASAR